MPVVEQDSVEEIAQCVALILSTEPGAFPDEPQLGLPGAPFNVGGISLSALEAAVRRWEPRALLNFTRDELAHLAQTVGVEVSS